MTLEESRRAGSEAPVPEGVTAVVLTHMRPRLAGDVTRSLLETEGLPADRVIVVVNGTGGLDDPALEARIRMVRLSRNTGPAGGFRAGLTAAFEDPATKWAYLCEDDVGLFALPTPRVADLLEADRRSGIRWSTGRCRGGLRAPVRGAWFAHGQRGAGGGFTHWHESGGCRLLGCHPDLAFGG